MIRLAARVCAICGMFTVCIAPFGYAFGKDSAPPALRAASLLADIEAHGARVIVDQLWGHRGRWDEAMTRIGGGSSAWLKVAVALRPGTDGGTAELLNEAIFFALKPEPIPVLRLLEAGQFDTQFVCSSNVGTDYPADRARHFVRDRIGVLTRVSDPTLRSVRERCLIGLRSALVDFQESEAK
jgi:hypothetical protein